MKKFSLPFLLLQVMVTVAFAQNEPYSSSPRPQQPVFPIVSAYYGIAAIYADSSDHWVVKKAASLLQDDIARITGRRIPIFDHLPKETIQQLIIIGSLDHSPLVQQLAQANRIPFTKIQGKWESYLLKTIRNPLPGIGQALVIAGSDRLGTAYGVFDLSKSLGVSPWYWWADVPVPSSPELYYFDNREKIVAPPAIKYRGLSINDEALALTAWVQVKFGSFNHQFYDKVYELTLRLKGNFIRPARHDGFNRDEFNPVLASRYGIAIDTSLYEPVHTASIPRIWEQLHQAKEQGSDTPWLIDAGAIKPLALPIEFFFDYAWNPDQLPASRLSNYTRDWAARQFGDPYAPQIADIISTYGIYNGRIKSSLLTSDTYSLFNYNEAERVVAGYKRLAGTADSIRQLLPTPYLNAYSDLVNYPVQSNASLNDLCLTIAKNRYYATQGRAATNDLAEHASSLFDKTPIRRSSELKTIDLSKIEGPSWGVSVENLTAWWPQSADSCTLPTFQPFGQRAHYIEIFNRTASPFVYTISSSSPWVQISPSNRIVDKEELLWIGIDWSRSPAGKGQATLTIHGPGGKTIDITVPTSRPSTRMEGEAGSFIESDGYVAIEAEHYSNRVESSTLHWLTIPGLGRTLSGVETSPSNVSPITPGGKSPRLEYTVYLSDTGALDVRAYLSIRQESNPRYGISFDNEQPRLIDADSAVSHHHIAKPGKHVLKFWFADPAIVLQRLVIDAGGVKPSYLGPPESPRN
ncbi:MAG: glycosyl hydrolase 115 family protein [Bacteroidetes bacterium]|nr:glycosyl hydrolase 115 family protein [Bacteroidota bacterium]